MDEPRYAGDQTVNLHPLGFQKRRKKDVHQITLCALLNKATKKWPRRFLKRSDMCANLASKAEEKKCLRILQRSAVSKLMWFLKSNDWTMFDALAANGLGIRSNPSSRARMKDFYKTLDRKQFPTLWRSMQRNIDLGCLKGMSASRIIDNLLMNRGRG
jgi:hypothetical protein